MKIVLLTPYTNAAHELKASLEGDSVAIFHARDTSEAWQLLQIHGASLDVALVHREGSSGTGDAGLGFVSKLRQDPAHSDLPIIITSEKWGDAEFSIHQSSPSGAHAYLKTPLDPAAVISVINQVLGSDMRAEANKAQLQTSQSTGSDNAPFLSIEPVATLEPSTSSPSDSLDLVIQDVSSVFEQSASSSSSSNVAPLDISSLIPGALPPGITEQITEQPTPFEADPYVAQTIAPDFVQESGAQAAISPEVSDTTYEGATRVISATPIEQDPQVVEEMPYLTQATQHAAAPDRRSPGPLPSRASLYSQPVDDAVVPGGAASTPDVETLKKYLLLREQDVAALSGQLRSAKDQVRSLEETIKFEKARNTELSHMVEEQKGKIDQFDKKQQIQYEAAQNEVAELKFQMKQRADKARLLESQMKEAVEEAERLKERVRVDIRKIRNREKELENRLEIMKKDSEALLGARENKIIELKRKLDLLEFNMDLLQDQYAREKQISATLRERLAKAAQAVRVAGGLLKSGSSENGELRSTIEGTPEELHNPEKDVDVA